MLSYKIQKCFFGFLLKLPEVTATSEVLYSSAFMINDLHPKPTKSLKKKSISTVNEGKENKNCVGA